MKIMGFKENLKAQLAYKNMLVKELAVHSGINKRTIDNYLRENGSIPPADAAVSIAQVLGVTVENLVIGHDSHLDKAFAPDTRAILKFLEELDEMDRKIVYNLVKSLKERKDAEYAAMEARA
jgi:transcriptional regulator with XRE-family HTH domain